MNNSNPIAAAVRSYLLDLQQRLGSR